METLSLDPTLWRKDSPFKLNSLHDLGVAFDEHKEARKCTHTARNSDAPKSHASERTCFRTRRTPTRETHKHK